MKKLIRLIIYTNLLVINLSCYSQNKLYHAQYTFEYNSTNQINTIASLFLNTMTYNIVTDGVRLQLHPEFDKNESDNFKITTSGPMFALYDIQKNQVSFDSNTDTIFKFKPIIFRPVDSQAVIKGYTCQILTNDRGDMIYYSESLPPYINPLFLNERSIKYGIVKAVLQGRGTYTIEKYYSTKENKIEALKGEPLKIVKVVNNIFFE